MNEDKPVAKGDLRNAVEGDRGSERPPLGGHPVVAAAGATVGAVAVGAAVGSVGGPVGTAVGAAIGAVAGAFLGQGIADLIDPVSEDAYWREHWHDRDYIDSGFTYDKDYGPAYRYGVDAHARYPERRYEDIETELAARWKDARGESALEWDRARHAARDAWHRVSERAERAMPGDSDRDGK